MRHIIGRIVNGEYIRVDEHIMTDESDEPDYFRGVAPSDLSRLTPQQLYHAADKLYGLLLEGRGTPAEQDRAAEAYHEVVRERHRRLATIH